ncbi:hypothetical protein DCAR_0935535 [Daucus carota subsp. sativus]|uniref:Uncharacterized protein n=1 Tax=Daucus carota subsp. sativus TaxID=79200 RepID=A0A175YHJ8_DAUCS|nr:PREDICTED: uncharacterized protein LOC108200265 [Daucus carota subsp. sativus]WOH15986.1 hypothetical protein DCAR_0935535 [Daucus carota subsp. sativus]
MNFFKSVFSDDPDDSTPQTTPTLPPNPEPNPNPNPDPAHDPTREISTVTTAWSFGTTLLKNLASKSESVIDTYRRDLEEFSSGIRKETEVIRQAASKAVHDLPGSLEAGAAVAQEKLESVGQVIDDFTDIIVRNRDILVVNDRGEEYDYPRGGGEGGGNVRAYSRVEALVRGVECDLNTYCREVEEVEEFEEWRKGFGEGERAGAIEEAVEGNGVIREIFEEVVPGKVSEEVFWERLFFRVWKVRKAEEARSRLVRRAISGDEEELSWDVDEEEFEECEERTLERGDAVEGKGRKLENEEEGGGKELGIGSLEETDLNGDKKVEETELSVDKQAGESGSSVDKQAGRIDEKVTSEGKTDSDISVISSQLSPEEEDLGWDEIEDIGSGDERKAAADVSPNKADLRKRLSVAAAADEEEDLTWDIEDDDEPVKS